MTLKLKGREVLLQIGNNFYGLELKKKSVSIKDIVLMLNDKKLLITLLRNEDRDLFGDWV